MERYRYFCSVLNYHALSIRFLWFLTKPCSSSEPKWWNHQMRGHSYKTKGAQVLNFRLTALLFNKLMGKCRCVLLTWLSSASQFHRKRKYCIFDTEIYIKRETEGRKVNDLQNGKISRDFFDCWKLYGFCNNLRFFWDFAEVLNR